jgi:hypothetical protein
VSSWFFGDGAKLFNDFVSISTLPGIHSLDSTLTSRPASVNGPTFGARITRNLTSRLAVEFDIDAGARSIGVDGSVKDALEGARSSFAAAFSGVFAAQAIVFVNPSASATSDVQTTGGHAVAATGALRFSFPAHGDIQPYVVVGGGAASAGAGATTATLVGHYAFGFHNQGITDGGFPVPIDETDTAVVHFTNGGFKPVGVFGAGFTKSVSRRSAIRVDGRVLVGPSQGTITVDATPSHVVASPHGAVAIIVRTPSLQFSTASAFQSSLSGAPLAGVPTFTGSGLRLQAAVTVGYVIRF